MVVVAGMLMDAESSNPEECVPGPDWPLYEYDYHSVRDDSDALKALVVERRNFVGSPYLILALLAILIL